MAESRRIQLTTLPLGAPKALVVDNPALPKSTTTTESPSDHNPEPPVRYVLALTQSDDQTFPEFSYTDLVQNKNGSVPVQNGFLPGTFKEEQNEEKMEMEAIARKFEEKYSKGNGRKKDRIQDLVDIGYGYDEEDSFIDNSEAYDEFVPASLTTKFGGFYVNRGVLQFRQVSGDDTDDSTTERTTPSFSKKRKLTEGGKSKPKKRRESVQLKTASDSNTGVLCENGVEEQVKKKKQKKPAVLSITDMLKKFEREKLREKQKMEKQALKNLQGVMPTINTPTMPLLPADAGGGCSLGLADPLLSLIGSTSDNTLIQAASTMDFDIDLVSLLDATNESSSGEAVVPGDPGPAQRARENQVQMEDKEGVSQVKPPLPQPSQPKPDVQPQSAAPAQLRCEAQSKMEASAQPLQNQAQVLLEPKGVSQSQLVPLPEGLPPALERKIGELTVAAKALKGESKLKFFTPEINSIILDIELQCRELGVQMRSKVYTHLSFFLPCSRDTLLKRVKKLLHMHLSQEPMHRLREAIGRVMPEQILRFHSNCLAVTQAKTSKDPEEGKPRDQKGSIGSEDEAGEKSGKRGPRKKFKWDEDTRECLRRVVKMKMERFEMGRSENEDMMEHLGTFLDNEVKPLWPKGWMPSRVLLKESRRVFNPASSFCVKKTKAETLQSSISGPVFPISGPVRSSDPPAAQGAPSQKTLSLGQNNPLGEGVRHNSRPLVAVEKELNSLKMGEARKRDTTYPVVVETDKQRPSNAFSLTAASMHSSLSLLAEQALAKEGFLQDSASPELLAAALSSATGDPRILHWNLARDPSSPPPPPPPPQSTPVRPPGDRLCHLTGNSMLQAAGLSSQAYGTQMITSSTTDATI